MSLAPEPSIRLRQVADSDLDVFFQHQSDPQATAMAAFPARDRATFDAHWAKIRPAPGVVMRTIDVGDQVAGYLTSWPGEGMRLLGYWVGREFWGRGVASRALALFVREIEDRPLGAHVAAHNGGSIRVLEKCGFRRVAQAPAAGDGVEEVSFVLDD
ncbi:GNAT family N-acetyltransferase [Actinoplanes sp. TFC3]|uniref:GNAT family N-acetyltransferase n=1 Tax=Actinoplanes sp. TFC3 TaxID=1710355 RepID=UPI000B14156A|nr:GNAT family N-acetyltransferase [Actinoplanes sp. TFC3]